MFTTLSPASTAARNAHPYISSRVFKGHYTAYPHIGLSACDKVDKLAKLPLSSEEQHYEVPLSRIQMKNGVISCLRVRQPRTIENLKKKERGTTLH